MNTQDKTRMDKVTVELTFDEALALTGVRFGQDRQIGTSARQKIRAACQKTIDFSPADGVDYEQLN
ncbi:hypothetical protein [Paenibacillus sp. TY11]|uniref:hypothetical protein n=1 Tax=Paenibacillus sp. TY11 TaxID=3448633 RepID=UPI00403A18A0